MEDNWYEVSKSTPPQGLIIDTKIDDVHGVRNQQKLILKKNIWFHDDMSMYIYYVPTHWRFVRDN